MQSTGILLLLVQIGFAIHALRRGYPIYWVFLIVFVPLIGCLLYVIMVLLPEFSESRVAADGARALGKALNPGKVLRERQEALEISDTIGNRVSLAEEYVRYGKFDEAIGLYESSLTGIYRTDPVVLVGLAGVQVEAGLFGPAKATLAILAQAHPDEDKPLARLLLARTLEGLGEREPALAEYERLMQTASGAEVKCRYAALLDSVGREAEARKLFEEILREAKAGNRHSLQLNKPWIEAARKALA